MSDSRTSAGSEASKTQKRSLPSWMSSGENGSKSHAKKENDACTDEESNKAKKPEPAEGRGKGRAGSGASKDAPKKKTFAASGSTTTSFSRLLEGVVFALSGFVNPERSILRSQALQMGAEYEPDWNSNCTLLVCAFPNTPKFRQVEADCGTIVSKEWMSECYAQKKLVDIDSYLMNAGKPWRRSTSSDEFVHDKIPSPPRKKQVVKGPDLEQKVSASTKTKASSASEEMFPLSKVRKWAIDDLNKTISWLESQEEKPEQSEIKQIAAEGILTCLQDAIDSLEQMQGVKKITEQWNFVPRVVKELAKLEGTENDLASLSNDHLCKQATYCKQIYEDELSRLDDNSLTMKRSPKTQKGKHGYYERSEANSEELNAYDSDETIEMTEEEIELAYNNVSLKPVNGEP